MSFVSGHIYAYRYAATLLVMMAALLCATESPAGDVVVLHSSDSSSPWTTGVDRGLSEGLENSQVVTSILLGSGDHDDDHFEEQFDILHEQWNGREPTVVVTDGAAAFAFMRKYREDLFGGAPVLYCGMNRPEPLYLSQCGNCAGIPLEYAVGETADLLFRLLPEATMVVGIMDGTPESRQLRAQAEQAMERYSDRAQIVFPGHEPGDEGGLDMDTLASVASSVPRSGAVLLLKFQKDATGRPVSESDAVKLLAERSAGPVFVLADWWMDSGVLGGVVVDAEAQGREIAGMIRRIGAGEPAREILAEAVKAKAVVDMTVMAQRSISAAGLPADVEQRNVPRTPEMAESVVSTGLVALGVALLAVLALVLFRRRAAQ
ncbi:hypothetical protein [Pseudodesulfovibrio sp. zrk46]|uniref:hypothetical protein n=1 Tax=Pseudodesulfovibrio sp. zrk46 TaxID=2725288 RepID=UPI001448F1AA|nr:hypothetical protein [Pseudodesulfovibrio sp. zrk46]QJB56078.1 hypothetical protein HFN16_06485 [Pseudodesulfovibrio sp. zrk46]